MDALIIFVAMAALIWGFWRLPWWRWFWVSVAILLGVTEGLAVLCTRKTISQQFWLFHAEHEATGWMMIGLLAAFCIILCVHLAWKQLKGKK